MVNRKKQPARFESWCPSTQGVHNQPTQPFPILRPALPTPAMLQENRKRFRQLKALSDASGVRFLFVYLYMERRLHLVRRPDVVPRITRALCQLNEEGLL